MWAEHLYCFHFYACCPVMAETMSLDTKTYYIHQWRLDVFINHLILMKQSKNHSVTSQTELELITDSLQTLVFSCVSPFLWQTSCSVATFNWQICKLCINLCKLHCPYLMPEMSPGVAWFHVMTGPVGHDREMTPNWGKLRAVTHWHTLNKQRWALYR